MDGLEMPLPRQRSVRSPPVRRTPILHNFLHMLSPRSQGPLPSDLPRRGSEGRDLPSLPLFQYPSRAPPPGCTRHLDPICYCGRCSSATPYLSVTPQNPQSQTQTSSPQPTPVNFSFTPRFSLQAPPPSGPVAPPSFAPLQSSRSLASERPSAFSSVASSAEAPFNAHGALEPPNSSPHGAPEPWGRLEEGDGSRAGGSGAVFPPRTSSSSSPVPGLRPAEASSSSTAPIYTSASEGRGPPVNSGAEASASLRPAHSTSSGHHPFYDGGGARSQNPASIRNVLQCNLSRYFLEYERMQDGERLARGGGGALVAPGGREAMQQLLSNNNHSSGPVAGGEGGVDDAERPGPSHYQPPSAHPHASLNRCRSCHNLLTFNHDTQRWERSGPSSSSSAASPSPAPSASSALDAASASPGPSSGWPFSLSAPGGSQEVPPPEQVRPQPAEPTFDPQQGMEVRHVVPREAPLGLQCLVYSQDRRQRERERERERARPPLPPRRPVEAAAQDALNQEVPVETPDEDSLRR